MLVMFVISCKRKCDDVNSNYIEAFVKGQFEGDAPPVNWEFLFFADIENDSVIVTKNFELYQIYKKNYLDKYSTFRCFVYSLYYCKLKLSRNDIIDISRNCYKFNNKKSIKVNDVNRYLSDGKYIWNKKMTYEENFSVLYSFFKSEYYITESDYLGCFSLIKCSVTN